MEDRRWRHEEQGRRGGLQERGGGLIELLRRVVAPRQPEVLVMERDGRLRRAGGQTGEPGE